MIDDVAADYQWSSDLEHFFGYGVADGGTSVSPVQGTSSGGMVTVTITGPVPDRLCVNLSATRAP